MNESRQIAQFVVDATVEKIPTRVISFASLLLLDQLGCQIAGAVLPWSQRVYDVVAPQVPTGRSTVVGRQIRTSADRAAYLNGVFGHSNEFDDTHLRSPTHPGAVGIPAAIAVAEEVNASGSELLRAIITSYEVMLHISWAVSPHLLARGHHPPPAVGPFGAAAASAQLYKLSPDETLNALAIAGSYSAGLQEYTQSGGSVKRLHCGIPAQAGVMAAQLARAGVTGPPTVLEGERGFCKVFSDHVDLSRLTKGLGDEYMTLETAIKFYSCCHAIQPVLDVLANLLDVENVDPNEISEVEIITQTESLVKHVGVIKEPTDILGAQFSMSFSVAMFLTGRRCGWWDYQNVDLNDPELLALSNRVSFRVENAIEDRLATGADVNVTMRDGSSTMRRVEHAHGEPESPPTEEEVVMKFLKLTTPVIGQHRGQEIVEIASSIWTIPDIQMLGELLTD